MQMTRFPSQAPRNVVGHLNTFRTLQNSLRSTTFTVICYCELPCQKCPSIQAFTRQPTVACRRRQHVFPKCQDAVTNSHSFISQTNGILSSIAAKPPKFACANCNVKRFRKKLIADLCAKMCQQQRSAIPTRLQDKRGSKFRTKNSRICHLIMKFIYQNTENMET